MAERTTSGKRGHNMASNSDSSDDGDVTVKPLRKIRAHCGFNLWHSDFSKTRGNHV